MPRRTRGPFADAPQTAGVKTRPSPQVWSWCPIGLANPNPRCDKQQTRFSRAFEAKGGCRLGWTICEIAGSRCRDVHPRERGEQHAEQTLSCDELHGSFADDRC